MIKRIVAVFAIAILLFLSLPPCEVSAANTEILRPNAAGDETALTIGGDTPAATNYESVDEAVADDETTYVYSPWAGATWRRDLYNLPAHSVGSGTINFVKIYFRCREIYAFGSNCHAKPSQKSGAVVTDGTDVSLSNTWTTYSQQYNINPEDSAAWEWADIDALQIGVYLQGDSEEEVNAACTQVYVEVDYTTAPDVATNAATYIAKTTARLNSVVIDDGGEACDIRFGYGDETTAVFANYDTITAWVEDTYTTGQHPYVDITGLTPNDEYFFRVQIKNNDSTVDPDDELSFTTTAATAVPTNLKAYPETTSIGLTWTRGTGTSETMIRYSETAYPTDETEGTQAYVGPLASYIITGLTAGHTYYIVAIGKTGAEYTATVEILATTGLGEEAVEGPDAPAMPSNWFQSPNYTGLSELPLYDQLNDIYDAFDMPRASGWFFTAILICLVLAVLVLAMTRHATPAVITLAVAMAFVALIKLLPLYFMAFSAVFIIGIWQAGRARG